MNPPIVLPGRVFPGQLDDFWIEHKMRRLPVSSEPEAILRQFLLYKDWSDSATQVGLWGPSACPVTPFTITVLSPG